MDRIDRVGMMSFLTHHGQSLAGILDRKDHNVLLDLIHVDHVLILGSTSDQMDHTGWSQSVLIGDIWDLKDRIVLARENLGRT